MQHEIIELVTFSAKDNTSKHTMIKANSDIHLWFRRQPGFLRRRLSQTRDGMWVDMIFWCDEACASQAASAFPHARETSAFRDLIEVQSVQFHVANVVLMQEGEW